jgi:hypothetical protein
MGGGTNAFKEIPPKTLEEAENLFKRVIEKVDKKDDSFKRESRNVFISFSMSDLAQVNLLRSQADDERFGLEFRDYSVKEPFDEKWRKGVSDRIRMTTATIVMIGPDTADKSAVKFEIEESYRLEKKVIGVRIYRNSSHKIPDLMVRNNAPIVSWNIKDIQRVLEGL